jgi:hypothetical protein
MQACRLIPGLFNTATISYTSRIFTIRPELLSAPYPTEFPGIFLMKRVLLLAVFFSAASVYAQAPYRAPRMPDGKPDLNGIWQALNEANYDLELHMARPALTLRDGPYGPVPSPQVLALGAAGAVPPGVGVVEGAEIPYKPEMLAKKKENQKNWLTSDPEIKCYLPGVPRATPTCHIRFRSCKVPVPSLSRMSTTARFATFI